MFDLNEESFLIYSAKCYKSLHLLQSEFDEDLKHIKYLKRLLRKYRYDGEFRERLILNHVIILSNVFGAEATTNILFYRIDKEDYPVLKTILMYLNYMPEHLNVTFNKQYLRQEEIPVDLKVANILRNI